MITIYPVMKNNYKLDNSKDPELLFSTLLSFEFWTLKQIHKLKKLLRIEFDSVKFGKWIQ